ncbi:hypothetical protein B0T26DRAFT_757760 [Lasiosphaeria miniovina]|uniref:Clr5 domain-containing protein n=1 Tax=Lasiosphaeria miniovina TaxID=1954250 RepID=A0AA39ZQE2_9PEZI|nr:uncharacterized protein B0T26DRAFT_757760 [Lasiosphaeria miniovina]KAK0701770.1 hypothetical protein B0T26DRAFT_757760 [Lasiosphaeria miniovina]
MGDSPEFKFVVDMPKNAARIDEKEWERLKDTILGRYTGGMKLEDVMEFMKEEHNFTATKRQYVHRIGMIWGVRKYRAGAAKKGTKKPGHRSTSPEGETKPSAAAVAPAVAPAPVPATSPPAGSRRTAGLGLADSQTARTTTAYVRDVKPGQLATAQTYSPAMGGEEKKRLYHQVANFLAALGDGKSCYQICALLYQARTLQDHVPDETHLDHVVACNQTQQTDKHSEEVLAMLQDNVDHLLDPDGSDMTWQTCFFDLLQAHAYDRGHDEKAAIGQIIRFVNTYLEPDLVLKIIPGRGYPVDIQAYQYLSYSLIRYNDNIHATKGHDFVDTATILDQFIGQQPAFATKNPLLLSCLGDCRAWCISVLECGPAIPGKIRHARAGQVGATYQILCTLWYIWMSELFPRSLSHARGGSSRRAYPLANWADDVKPQLGISPSELLTTVVCMIMAAAPFPHDDHAAPDFIEQALAGARDLDAVSPEDLIRRFLDQVRETSDRRLTTQVVDERDKVGVAEIIQARKIAAPFRNFIASAFGDIELPALDKDAIVIPVALTTAREVDREDGREHEMLSDPLSPIRPALQTSDSQYPAVPPMYSARLQPTAVDHHHMLKLQINERGGRRRAQSDGGGAAAEPPDFD